MITLNQGGSDHKILHPHITYFGESKIEAREKKAMNF
jgi:hypothetical protein